MQLYARALRFAVVTLILASTLLLADNVAADHDFDHITVAADQDFDDLTIAAGQTLTLTDGNFTVEDNIEVSGTLVLENCSFDMSNEFSAVESEIRIQPGGSLTVRDCSLTSTANLTPVRALYDQYIEVDPDNTTYYETSIETAFAQLNATAVFRVVLDDGELLLNRVNMTSGRLWLVGGNATLFDTRLDGESSFPENSTGLFIEDTSFLANNLTLANYDNCLRAVGVAPVLSNVNYANCTTQHIQEWWLNVTVEDTAGERLGGLHVAQRDDAGMALAVAEEQPDGSYVDWYEEYRLLGNGNRTEPQVSITVTKIYEFYSLEGLWEGDLDGNTQVTITVETNRSLLSFSDMRLEVDGQLVESSQPVSKWSTLSLNATLVNPTDCRMSVVVQLAVNDVIGYSSTLVELAPRSVANLELDWNISIAGDLSLSLVADNSILPDGELRISRYLQVTSDTLEEEEEQEQPWLALLLLLALAGGAAWALLSESEPEAGEAVAAEEETNGDSDAPSNDEHGEPADGGGGEEADELADDEEGGNAESELPDDED
ncbi:MAG: hypothetical protein QF822_03935 [Candidatus Poseidoniia archaeon]|jgi:hypothetical protein|nr:hypothetical protein [Candidatus Poseidoniia archaeon]MDP6534351.1 hypothetical protein [Candidatus Poseidoniia archaeon]MDP6834675.1 hypothetical protein [Candidatus Poseidoniia archaeon]